MFLAVRDLRRSWRRFALVGAVVGLVAVLSTVLAGLADGLVRDGTSGLRRLPLTHLAFEPHAASAFSRSTLDERALAGWQAAPGVLATPVGTSFVNAAPVGGGSSLDLALFGVAPGGFLAGPLHAAGVAGAQPGLVLDASLREQGARVGARYRLGGSGVTLPVAGFAPTGSYGHVAIALTPLGAWRSVAYGNDPRGRFSAIALRVGHGADLAAADRRAGTEVETKAQAYAGSPGFTAETATMTLIRAFLLAISALIVGAFFSVLTVQRTRQIGLLKAMGASTAYVLRDGIGEMTAVVAGASVAGALAGTAIVAALRNGPVPVALSPSSIATSAVLLVVAGTLGSLVTFRRVAQIQPAIALGVEA
jgi:putative ABC transport system permease protein